MSAKAEERFYSGQREKMAEEIRILKHAEREGYLSEPGLQQRLISYVARSYMRDHGVDARISDAEARAYYRKNREQFTVPEKRIARQILFAVADGASEAEADEVRREAAAFYDEHSGHLDPVEFGNIASRRSDDASTAEKAGVMAPTAQRGEERSVTPAVAEALFALDERGDMTRPVRSSEGWHVLVLAQRVAGIDRTYEQVSALVKSRMRSERRQALLQKIRVSGE
jgi:parvulin-like peptidyl-prolyl isomerase